MPRFVVHRSSVRLLLEIAAIAYVLDAVWRPALTGADPGDMRPTALTVWAAIALLAAALVHELGHVAAGLALGMRWKAFHIASTPSVVLTGRRTNRGQALISFAGPASALAVGSIGLLVADKALTLPWLLGVAGCFDGFVGLLCSWSKNGDARKLWSALAKVARGHGGRLWLINGQPVMPGLANDQSHAQARHTRPVGAGAPNTVDWPRPALAAARPRND